MGGMNPNHVAQTTPSTQRSRGSTELEFRLPDCVVDRGWTVSRVPVLRIQLAMSNTGRRLTTRSDTMRLRTKCVLVPKIFCIRCIRRAFTIQQRDLDRVFTQM